jgi:hypothetical protein
MHIYVNFQVVRPPIKRGAFVKEGGDAIALLDERRELG